MFVSFDTLRDGPIREFFINQGRREDSTWIVTRWSEEFNAEDPMWIPTTKHRMTQAEVLVVLLGST